MAFSGLWPGVTASGGYQRIHDAAAIPDNQHWQDLYQAGLDAVWELDLFGGVRRNVESANANIQAATENIRDVRVSVTAEVALSYISLRGYQQEIVLAQNNLKAQKHIAEITVNYLMRASIVRLTSPMPTLPLLRQSLKSRSWKPPRSNPSMR